LHGSIPRQVVSSRGSRPPGVRTPSRRGASDSGAAGRDPLDSARRTQASMSSRTTITD